MSQNYPIGHSSHYQKGASVSGIVMFIITLVVAIKLGLAIVPGYIENYQLNKSIAWELKKANDNKESAKELLGNLTTQWSINGYTRKPEDIITITNGVVGGISVRTEYDNVSNFFSNVDIVTRFKKDISAQDAKSATK